MLNVTIVDRDLIRARICVDNVRALAERLGMTDEVTTTTLAKEAEIDGEAIILYGYDGDSMDEGDFYARIMLQRTGVATHVVSSDCLTVGKIDGFRQWAGYVAVHAKEGRVDEIVEKLKGKMDPGIGLLAITTFDVEKHIIGDDGLPGLHKPPFIMIVSTDQEDAEAFVSGLQDFGYPGEIFSKRIAGFVMASGMET